MNARDESHIWLGIAIGLVVAAAIAAVLFLTSFGGAP